MWTAWRKQDGRTEKEGTSEPGRAHGSHCGNADAMKKMQITLHFSYYSGFASLRSQYSPTGSDAFSGVQGTSWRSK